MFKKNAYITSSFSSVCKRSSKDQPESIETNSEVQKAVSLLWEDYNGVTSAVRKGAEGLSTRKLGRDREIEEEFEKGILQSTIDGLNERLLEQRIKVAELRKENKIHKREKIALKNDLDVHVAEVNYLTKISAPSGDPYVVRKIVMLEKLNRELIAKYQKLVFRLKRNSSNVNKKNNHNKKKKRKKLPRHVSRANFKFKKLQNPEKLALPKSTPSPINNPSYFSLLKNPRVKTIDVQTEVSTQNWVKTCANLLSLLSVFKKSRLSSKSEMIVEINPGKRTSGKNLETSIGRVSFPRFIPSLNFSIKNIVSSEKYIDVILRLSKTGSGASGCEKLSANPSAVDNEVDNAERIEKSVKGRGEKHPGKIKPGRCTDVQTKGENKREKVFLSGGLDAGLLLRVKNYPARLSRAEKASQTLIKFIDRGVNFRDNRDGYESGVSHLGDDVRCSSSSSSSYSYSSSNRRVSFDPEVKFYLINDISDPKTRPCVKRAEFIQRANDYFRIEAGRLKNGAESLGDNLIHIKFDYHCKSVNYGRS